MRVWGWLAVSLLTCGALATSACSKSSDPAGDDEEGTPRQTQDGGTSVPNPNPSNPNPQTSPDGAVLPQSTSDGGIQGPTFDLTKINMLQGTFVTDKTGLQGVQSNATVNWTFKIDNINVAGSTAKWTAQATNVTGGNIGDFPGDNGLSLSITPVTGTGSDPGAGGYDLFGTDQTSHYVYVLVQIRGGRIADLYYYRRLLDDSETNPADKPRNVSYTAQ